MILAMDENPDIVQAFVAFCASVQSLAVVCLLMRSCLMLVLA